MDRLGNIELFVQVVKNKGLAAAGRKLGLSPATVTARINSLEKSCGVRLLNRTTRKVSLTQEGEQYYRHCISIIQEVKKANESLVSADGLLSGLISITTTMDIGEQIIGPAMNEFIQLHPGISVHLHLEDRIVDIVEGEFDLGIRFDRNTAASMKNRKLADNRRVLFASPSYLSKNGTPNNPAELSENHEFLALVREDQALRTWFLQKDDVETVIDIKTRRSSNDGSMVRKWAIEGYGIALKSIWDIQEDIRAGRLSLVMPDYYTDYSPYIEDQQANIYAVYSSDQFLPRRIEVFLDFLSEYFSELAIKYNN